MLSHLISVAGRVRQLADAIAYTTEREAGAWSRGAPRVSALLLRVCHAADAVEGSARRVERGLEHLRDVFALVAPPDEQEAAVLEDPRDTP
jgi:hypothetical protein